MTVEPAATDAWRTGSGQIDDDVLARIDAWWRVANYLSVGQIYLLDNPLMREPLSRDHVKPRLLGHWGTTPGLTFLYAHLNRAIAERSQSTIYVTGPGHGGPGLVASAYLDGTYSEVYSDITEDAEGLRRLFRQFSFPGGIPSHVAPETPGSIHEGGELGYALSHAYGAAFDNPDLLVAAVVGDGEAETGPLATSWHSTKFVNPAQDGVVLPILHLNGYKIANPTVLARIREDELTSLMVGFGHKPHVFTAGFDDEDHLSIHRRFATLLDEVLDEIAAIKARAAARRPRAPDVADDRLPHPEGLDGPGLHRRQEDHRLVAGPPGAARQRAGHARAPPGARRPGWRATGPEELFDGDGRIRADIRTLAPAGQLRMSDNPHANGGLLLKDLRLPDFRAYAVDVPTPGGSISEAPRVLGEWLTDVIRLNPDNFRIFGPDETASNRLQAVFDVTDKQWNADFYGPEVDEHLARAGRVLEMLSEHQMQGWLEGYLLTGRHGLFNCYEAFIHIVDSMVNQHAKWLKVTAGHPVAPPHREPELPAVLARVAPGPQRLLPPGPRLHRPRGQQEGRDRAGVPAAGRQHPAVHLRPLPAQPGLRQRRGRRQAAGAELPDHGPGDRALHARRRDLGLGRHRGRGRGAGRRAGLRRRRADPRGAGGGRHPAPGDPGAQGPRGQRRGPHASAGRARAPARALRPRVRHPVHGRPPDRVRLPRVPVARSTG